jgi:hypothetical protein
VLGLGLQGNRHQRVCSQEGVVAADSYEAQL